ncbi:MAG: hypothetical protein AMXMBFR34_38000 [Myxococcaceae bacterium]
MPADRPGAKPGCGFEPEVAGEACVVVQREHRDARPWVLPHDLVETKLVVIEEAAVVNQRDAREPAWADAAGPVVVGKAPVRISAEPDETRVLRLAHVYLGAGGVTQSTGVG